MAHAITDVYKVVEQFKKVKEKYREKHDGIKKFKQDLDKTMVFWTKENIKNGRLRKRWKI